MSKRPAKSLEDLDQHILAEKLGRDPQELARLRQKFFSAIGLGMLAVGMIMFIIGVLEARKLINDWQWPTTTAEYTGGWLRTSGGISSIVFSRYCFDPSFSYEVNGEAYEFSSIASDCSNSMEAIDEQTDSYANTLVTVWYDPTYPTYVSHHRISIERPLIIWLVSAGILLLGGIFLALSLRQPAEKRKMKQPSTPL